MPTVPFEALGLSQLEAGSLPLMHMRYAPACAMQEAATAAAIAAAASPMSSPSKTEAAAGRRGRGAKGTRRGPMDEMRQLVRILVKVRNPGSGTGGVEAAGELRGCGASALWLGVRVTQQVDYIYPLPPPYPTHHHQHTPPLPHACSRFCHIP